MAGGKSSRAEKIKGLRKINGDYWIDIVLKHYQKIGLSDTFVGLGYHHKQYQNKSLFLSNSSYKTAYAINETPDNGSFSTLQITLKQALTQRWDFAIVAHIDCALTPKNTLDALLKETQYSVVKPIFNNKSGHPIKLSRNFCKEIILKPRKSQLKKEIRSINKSRIYWKKIADDSIHYNLNTEKAWQDYVKTMGL